MRVRTRLVRASIALLIGVGVLCVGGGAMAAPGDPGGRKFVPGAPGAGDAYFPFAGNGGYDVQRYDLDITYAPPAADPAPLVGQLRGVATIDMVATQDLDRFNLDLRGMDVQAIKVNGRRLREVTPPGSGAVVGGPAYWQVQDDEARVWELTRSCAEWAFEQKHVSLSGTRAGAEWPSSGIVDGGTGLLWHEVLPDEVDS